MAHPRCRLAGAEKGAAHYRELRSAPHIERELSPNTMPVGEVEKMHFERFADGLKLEHVHSITDRDEISPVQGMVVSHREQFIRGVNGPSRPERQHPEA